MTSHLGTENFRQAYHMNDVAEGCKHLSCPVIVPVELYEYTIWEFPKIGGTLFWGPYNKDPSF